MILPFGIKELLFIISCQGSYKKMNTYWYGYLDVAVGIFLYLAIDLEATATERDLKEYSYWIFPAPFYWMWFVNYARCFPGETAPLARVPVETIC